MRIESVHTRELPVPVEELGRLLDTLAGPDDRIWPIERWPNDPILFDRPLSVGAKGGHGPIRYTVTAYEPGRLIEFEFDPGSGLRGLHRLLRPMLLAMHDASSRTCSTRPSWRQPAGWRARPSGRAGSRSRIGSRSRCDPESAERDERLFHG